MKLTLLLILLSLSSGSFALRDPIGESMCLNQYQDIFAKNEITVMMVFGYDDYYDATAKKTKVFDNRNLKIFVDKITLPCTKMAQKMCGFKVLSTAPTIMTKKITGPDGRPRTLKIVAESSSISEDDQKNRIDPLQKLKTKRAQDIFKAGLQSAEVTFYNGHSRDGGGPSFEPPKLDAYGHVNYSYYHKNKKDKIFMVDALKKAPEKNRLVALLSCDSFRWFYKGISNNAPSTGFIGTDEVYTTGAFRENIEVMERLFSYDCLSELKVPDATKKVFITNKKLMKVSSGFKNLTRKQMDQIALRNLALNLKHPDINIRKEAFFEIKSFNSKLYSPEVHRALKDYSFGNVVQKNL